jgi:dethiobiotin synthetase
MSSRSYFITGIGTDVGKTVVSAILTKAFNAHYWKPIQSGIIDGSDSDRIRQLVPGAKVLPEQYRLKEALSPHAAAALEGIEIELKELELPEVEGNLIVEGAGGLMVPINFSGDNFLDLIKIWKLPVIVVSRHYLGSINHTLLTIELLKYNGIELAGIIFVGSENRATEQVIEMKSGAPILARIPEVSEVNLAFVDEQATILESALWMN